VANRVIIYILFNIIASVLIGLGYKEGVLLSSINTIGFILIFARRYGTNSYAFIFGLGYVLYGYISPLTDVYDSKFSFFGYYDFKTFEFIVVNNLAGIGLVLGTVLKIPNKPNAKLYFPKNTINYAILFALFATVGEVSNILRAGGFGLVSLGKAIYQDQLSSLFLTAPSILFANISFSFFGFYLSREEKKNVYKIIFYFVAIVGILVLFLLLGRRGALIQFVIAFVLSYRVDKKVIKISFTSIVVLLIGLSLSSFIFATRGMIGSGLQNQNLKIFTNYLLKDKRFLENFYKGLNPAYSEFAAPLLNYSVHRNKNKLKSFNSYGGTYLNGVINDPFPRWFFINGKEPSISTKFRDTYFNSLGKRSRIAGTAFSSILEAYLNFGIIGIFFVYFVFGILLNIIEYFRRNSNFYIFYLVILGTFGGTALRFHRSHIGLPIGILFFNIVVVFIIAVILSFFFNFNIFFRKIGGKMKS